MSFKLQIPWKFGKVTLKGSIYICGLGAFHQNTLRSPSLPLLNRKLENRISKIEINRNKDKLFFEPDTHEESLT